MIESKPVDVWSLVHFVSGLFIGKRTSTLEAIQWLAIFEIAEPSLYRLFGWDFTESGRNQIADIAIGSIGVLVAKIME